jgi:hypothetical protein
VATATGLDAGLLVGTADVILGAQSLARPHICIEVQHRPGLLGKVGITRNDPVLVPPWFDGIRIQHPPHCAPTDRFAQRFAGPGGDVSQGLPTQRLLGFCDEFTGEPLNQRMVQTEKKPPYGPVLARLPGKSPPWPTGGATVAPTADAAVPVPRPQCWTPAVVGAKAEPAWLVAAPDTERFFAVHAFRPAPRMLMGTRGGSSGGDHAWEASFGENDLAHPEHASHCSTASELENHDVISETEH